MGEDGGGRLLPGAPAHRNPRDLRIQAGYLREESLKRLDDVPPSSAMTTNPPSDTVTPLRESAPHEAWSRRSVIASPARIGMPLRQHSHHSPRRVR